MALYTETPGTARCNFQNAEGRICGDAKVYGTDADAYRFCWSHYVIRCAECTTAQALFECAMLTASGRHCRMPICSQACYKAHQKKHHPAAWQPAPRKLLIQVVFADGSIFDHTAEESTLVDEIVFEHPVLKTHHRCLKKPMVGPGGSLVYAEPPRVYKSVPAPLEIPRTPPPQPQPQPQPAPPPSPRSGGPFQTRTQNAVTGFCLHISWLTALIETRDERILRVLPPDILQRLEQSLMETTVALLESNHHGG